MKVNLPKQLITSALLLFFYLNLTQFANAQCPVTAPNFSIGCGSSASLVANPAFVSYTPIPNSTLACGPAVIPTNVAFPTACDDCVTTAIPIGFPFNFYSNTYTNGYISSNGILGFSNTPLDYDNYDTNPIPSTNGANNFIAGLYADIDIRCGGTITYGTAGTAPNRRFIVSYNNVAPYGGGTIGGCTGTGTTSFQIILNENNGNSSFNIVITQLSANWFTTSSLGGSAVTVGAENLDGSVGLALPGMNEQDFGAIVPGDNFCYTFTSSPCTFVNWKDGATVISNLPTFAVSPTATKTYTATWQCGPTTCTDPILITVISPTLVRSTIKNNTNCSTPNGSIRFTTNFANGTYTLSYDKNGTPTTASVTVAAGVFLLTGLDSGSYTNFSLPISVGCPSILITEIVTITTAPRTMLLNTVVNSTNCATPNGSISFTTTNVPNGTYTLSYTKNGTATTASITITAGASVLSSLDIGTYTAFSLPTPAGCNAVSVAGPAIITSPTSPTGTGVSICTGGSGSLSSAPVITTTVPQSTTFNIGTLAVTDPRWNTDTDNDAVCEASAGTNQYYDVVPFTVSTTGSYTFNMCTPGTDWDGYAAIYQNAFNGANPCGTPSNFIRGNDDGNGGGNCDDDARLTVTLTVGITYYLVTTSFSVSATGNYEWTYTGPASASITVTTTSTPPTIPQGTFNAGALATTDPTWMPSNDGACTSSGITTYYDVFTFTVSTNGNYTFDMCTPGGAGNWNGFASLYQANFIPTALCTNWIASDNDSNNSGGGCNNDPLITATLSVGVTYYLVTTSWFSSTTGTYDWFYSGPGGATISGSTNPLSQWYTAASGGTPIGTGNSFNPVGVAGSGLANTATAGTTTYYLAYSNAPACRTPIAFVISAAPTAPTSISNTGGGFVCNGSSVTLSAVGGSSGGGAGVLTWYETTCGTGTLLGTGASIAVFPTVNTTYFARYEGICGNTACVSTTITVNTVATAPTITTLIPAFHCPNTDLMLTASGGVAGSGSSINWYSAPLGGGSLLGTGATLTVAPMSTTTYYVRRDGGTCGDSPDASVVVTVRNFAYATGVTTTSSNYCLDNSNWQHFYNANNEIYFSIKGNIGATPTAIVNISGASFQEPNMATNCPAVNPNEEKFEMARSWNFSLGATAPTGTYQIRFYYLTAERTAIEAAALAWKDATANTACVYGYKYPVPNGFYWFKNASGTYVAPEYDGLKLNSSVGNVLGIDYAEIVGITSFSGGSGAVTLVPLVPLPVSLLSFSGKRMTTNQVKISWETVQEVDNAGFEVEMSADARNFEKIGFMKAQGNNKTVASYEMPYTNSVGGYFRLKQLDNNGRYVYSKIIYIDGTTESIIRIYPNPATDNVTIDLGQLKDNESATATFKSMLGVVVGEKNLSQVQTDISVGHLAKGIYILEINKNGKKIIEKIVLQ